jgi:pyruvate dehydrogenase E2 component (dihydrolipoamide acetyltransferase)
LAKRYSGEIHEAPLVQDGEEVVGEATPLSATFDHRLLDGVHAANMVRLVKRLFGDPFAHFGRDPRGLRR